MSQGIEVSVIIPVYMAKKFLRHSVMSAVGINEVKEVLLIEDGSPDTALELCQNLQKEFEKVKLFQHPHGHNKGAGASRNLGIEKSTCEFIAFLDADDWYLPNRFQAEMELFKDDKIEGVYGATGFFEEGKGIVINELTSFHERISPEDLLYQMVNLKGRFTTNAITIRRTLFKKAGYFNPVLRLHQDTHLWYRLAFFGVLLPGRIEEAIAIRRVHPGNRIKGRDRNTRMILHKEVFKDFLSYQNVDKRAMRIIVNRYVKTLENKRGNRLRSYLRLFRDYPHLVKIFWL